MTDIEIATKIETHSQLLKNLEKRVDNIESIDRSMHEMALSSQKMMMNIEQLMTKQSNINTRLEDIERKPAQAWNNMTRTIFTTIVSAIAGGLAVAVVQAISMGAH